MADTPELEPDPEAPSASASDSSPNSPSTEPATAPAPRELEEDDEFPGVDGVIGTFMSEASLWPVLIVVLGSGGAFGAAMMILAGVDRNPFAAAALLLLGGMSIDVGLRARRESSFGNLAKLVGLIWAAAIGFAALALWTGIAYG